MDGLRDLVLHKRPTYYSWCIQGLANYYRYSRHAPSLDLARGLYHWVRDRSNHFGPDGRFLREYPNTDYTHFHGHTMVLYASPMSSRNGTTATRSSSPIAASAMA